MQKTELDITPTTLTGAYKAGRDQALEFMRDSILKAIDNPALDIIPARMALQVLLASMPKFDEEDSE